MIAEARTTIEGALKKAIGVKETAQSVRKAIAEADSITRAADDDGEAAARTKQALIGINKACAELEQTSVHLACAVAVIAQAQEEAGEKQPDLFEEQPAGETLSFADWSFEEVLAFFERELEDLVKEDAEKLFIDDGKEGARRYQASIVLAQLAGYENERAADEELAPGEIEELHRVKGALEELVSATTDEEEASHDAH